MRSEILSVGTELLNGHITDTNATFLAQQLVSLGIPLARVTQVGDNLDELTQVISSVLERSDLLICTGGIGPTPDDLTREAITTALDEQMSVDPELERELRTYFSNRSRPMPATNIKQATLIPSARPVKNRSGTAPGWWVEKNGNTIITMPGVPHEMKTMWLEEILPQLQGKSGNFIVTEILKYQGDLGESGVAQVLGDLLKQENPWVATYAKPDGIHIAVQGTGSDEAAVTDRVAEVADAVRDILGDAIWGTNADTLADLVERGLRQLGLTLSSREDGTAGSLSRALSHAAPSPYLGGTVFGGEPPKAELTLVSSSTRVGTSENGRAYVALDISLYAGATQLDQIEIRAPSEAALEDRAVNAAISLLFGYIKSLAPAPFPA